MSFEGIFEKLEGGSKLGESEFAKCRQSGNRANAGFFVHFFATNTNDFQKKNSVSWL